MYVETLDWNWEFNFSPSLVLLSFPNVEISVCLKMGAWNNDGEDETGFNVTEVFQQMWRVSQIIQSAMSSFFFKYKK